MPSSQPAIPKAPDVEQAVLGAAMRDREALYEVIDRLTVDAFAQPVYRHVWEAMRELVARNQPVDLLTVTTQLEERGVLEVCGGRGGLIDIADSVFTAVNIAAHADILIDYQRRRGLWHFSHSVMRDLKEDPDHVVARAESRMLAISEIGRETRTGTDRQIERMIATDTDVLRGKLSGYSWSIPDLSRVTRGIRPGRMYLIIALFKTGKSKLVIATIHEMIARQKIPVLFISVEMGATQVFHWLAGYALKINTALFGSAGLSEAQMRSSHDWIMQHVGSGLLCVDDRAVQTPESVCSAMRYAAMKDGVKVVFIDYLQRIAWSPKQPSVADIGRGMNLIAATAKRLGVAVIALSQVPKSVEQQPAKKLITLGDVKDAAVFAEVADASVAITDPNRHKQGSRPQKLLKFLVEQRDGPTRVLDIQADLRYGHFESVVRGDPNQEPIFDTGQSSAEPKGEDRDTRETQTYPER